MVGAGAGTASPQVTSPTASPQVTSPTASPLALSTIGNRRGRARGRQRKQPEGVEAGLAAEMTSRGVGDLRWWGRA